jgi:ATP adenylyltransferase
VDYKELEKYIKKMQMMHIYQPVMIKTLLNSNNKATTDKIARAFLEKDQSQIDYYKMITKSMPGKVLRKHKIVDYKNGYFRLQIDDITEKQKEKLVELCDKRLEEYQDKHGKKIWQHRARDNKPISGSLRYDVLAKAKGKCVACGISAEERALDIDHILPRNQGGKTEISNLQALCYKCNSEKRDRDDTDFLKWKEKFSDRDSKCIFCKQVKTIATNDLALAVYDKFPVTKLHVLIIPKRHTKTFFDLIPAEKNLCLELVDVIKTKIQEKDKSVTGFNVGFNSGKDSGQTVMHCHIHVIPRRKGDSNDPTGGVRNVIPEMGKYT